jgi:hypothetical protein
MLNLLLKALKNLVEWFLYNKENDDDELAHYLGGMDLTDYGADTYASAPWGSFSPIHKKSFEIFEDPGNESEATTILMDLDDKEETHFSDLLSEHIELKSYANTPKPLVMDIASPSRRLLDLRKLYNCLHYLDTDLPVLAALARSTRWRVEEVDCVVGRWERHSVWIQHYRHEIDEREENLEEEGFTNDEVVQRAQEIINCKTIEAIKELSARGEKEQLLAALDMYQADPQPANGRSVGAYLLDVLSLRKGKCYARWEQSDWKEPQINMAAFSTTGDLFVWECRNHLWYSHLAGWELDLEVFEALDEAKGKILEAEGWDPEYWRIEEVEEDEICEDWDLD